MQGQFLRDLRSLPIRIEQKAQALIREIELLGVKPFEPAKPLPVIEPTEIHLICWMAVAKAT